MIRNDKIFIFDFPFNRNLLLQTMYDHEEKFEVYEDPKHGTNDVWLKLLLNFDYATELNKFFGINGSPRFYKLLSGKDLDFHQDYGTICSLNVLLSEDAVAPITFEDGMETFLYQSAVLNVQKTHGVFNNPDDRLLFKLSIFDESYESVCDKVAARL